MRTEESKEKGCREFWQYGLNSCEFTGYTIVMLCASTDMKTMDQITQKRMKLI
jgi:hypothetical protein